VVTDHNAYFSVFKIKQVEIAGLWYKASLGCFAALSLLLVAYTALSAVAANPG
jgi:hypothetical protein